MSADLGMGAIVARLGAMWRKNPEVAGLWSGALPDFVTSHAPQEPLDGLPVFTFHLVEAQSLERQLAYLRRNDYHFVSGRELLGHLGGQCRLPERSALLTFDDGPRNFHDVALPLLEQYRASAIAFVAPGLHADSYGDDDASEARPMTWSELRAVHASGLVEVQSHTLESRFVPRWPAPAPLAGVAPRIETPRRGPPRAFADDLAASRDELQSRLTGAVVDQLAFPMYVGTEGAVATAIALGFRACHWGLLPKHPLNPVGSSAFRISRVSDEFVERLPGEGRCSFADLVARRLQRSRAASAWRSRYG